MRICAAYFIIAIAILAVAAQAQQPCVISGYINKNDLTPAKDHILRVNATVPLDPVSGLFSSGSTSDTSDAYGYIEMTVTRNSIIYVSCDPRRPVKGFPTTPPGIALVVPDAPTHQLAMLLPPTTVPPQHIVAIPALSNYGDSIRIADSLARVALDSASSARQELLSSIAQLQAQLDTAGATTRAVIEADIAALYGQVSTLSGQIAALSARVDTVGAAARATLEADVADLATENATQDLLIADAGKWEQTGTIIEPKDGIDSVKADAFVLPAGDVGSLIADASTWSKNTTGSSVFWPDSGWTKLLRGQLLFAQGSSNYLAYSVPSVTGKGQYYSFGIGPDGIGFHSTPTFPASMTSANAWTVLISDSSPRMRMAAFGQWNTAMLSTTSRLYLPATGTIFDATSAPYRVTVEGGIALDTLRGRGGLRAIQIPANLEQHPDSLSKLGIVQTQRVVIDTFGVNQSDSMRYFFIGEKLPIAYQPGSEVTGSRTYRFAYGERSAMTKIMIAVADTANGVRITRLEMNIGSNYNTTLLTQSTGRMIATARWAFRVGTPIVHLIDHTPGAGTSVYTSARGYNAGNTGGAMGIEFWSPAPHLVDTDVEVTVHYVMPTPTSSTQPVFLKL